jgi:hypothetical protein
VSAGCKVVFIVGKCHIGAQLSVSNDTPRSLKIFFYNFFTSFTDSIRQQGRASHPRYQVSQERVNNSFTYTGYKMLSIRDLNIRLYIYLPNDARASKCNAVCLKLVLDPESLHCRRNPYKQVLPICANQWETEILWFRDRFYTLSRLKGLLRWNVSFKIRSLEQSMTLEKDSYVNRCKGDTIFTGFHFSCFCLHVYWVAEI